MIPHWLVDGISAAFDLLLRNSVQAALLILIVLALRSALAGRLSARWLHALWLVALVRLVLPWAPASSWSPFGLLPEITPREKAVLDPDSRIDENGRIVDNVDRPFINDPELIGKWESVDFVKNKGQFRPASRNGEAICSSKSSLSWRMARPPSRG